MIWSSCSRKNGGHHSHNNNIPSSFSLKEYLKESQIEPKFKSMRTSTQVMVLYVHPLPNQAS